MHSGEIRKWLAQVIAGAPSDCQFLNNVTAAELVREANEEGVVVLVERQLLKATTTELSARMLVSVCEAFTLASRDAALLSMVLQAESVAVLKALEAVGVPALMLKGNALAHWAYPQPHMRACSDVDVLVPSRKDAELLAAELQRQGYVRSATSGPLVAYELMCRREAAPGIQVEIDVHWRMANSVLFADAFGFEELMASSMALPSLGPNARALGPVHACIHSCVHRALNLSIGIPDRLKWLYDIDLLMRNFDASEWTCLVDVARTKGLAGVVLGGLGATALAFGRGLPEDSVPALRDSQGAESLDIDRLSDWKYMQRMTYNALPGVGDQFQWILQRIFPSKAYLALLYSAPQASYYALIALRIRGLVARLRGGIR